MRNAELKGRVRSREPVSGSDARTLHSAFRTPHSALGMGGGCAGRRRRRRHLHRPRRARGRRRDRGPQGRDDAAGSRAGNVPSDRASVGSGRHPGPRHDDRDQRAARAARRARGARDHARLRGPPVAQATGPRGVVRPGAGPSTPARRARRRARRGGAYGSDGRAGAARRRGGETRGGGGSGARSRIGRRGLPVRGSTPRARAAHRRGPTGRARAGLVGAAVGLSELLTLDMGGTSADASLVTGGTAVHDAGGAVAEIPLALPSILIETVSAGGGSIARVDEGGALKVGPESAGAVPGPACYGRGGARPTVTDACLVLGWLDAASPLADEVRLDPSAAARAVTSLGDTAGHDAAAIAAGIVAVAAAVMARALRRVSVARGLDPRRMALVPFGGAGPLFGCALADALGVRRIVIPPHPGVLSALGLAAAAERVDLFASYHRELDRLQPSDLDGAFGPLLREGSKQLPEGALWRYADCRFAGQGYEVTVPVTTNHPRQIRDTFLAAHHARFGHSGGGSVELVTLRVVAVREAPLPRFTGTS